MQINPFGSRIADACSRLSILGEVACAQVKRMAARRQMRTSGERTFGAWTDGRVVFPDGRSEMIGTAGNGWAATPNILREHARRQVFQSMENLPDRQTQQPREHIGWLAKSQYAKKGEHMKQEVNVKVTFTDGYEERFTAACIKVAQRRIEQEEAVIRKDQEQKVG